jgi:hypothetical protein
MPRKFVTYRKFCLEVSWKRRPYSVGCKGKKEVYTLVG